MDRRKLSAWAVAATVATAFVPGAAEAQLRRRDGGVPPGHLPPPGECRVWYDDRPPGHQPAPTSCEAARREAYRTGGRVVYGGERRDDRYDRRDWPADDRRRGRDDDDECRDRDRDGRCDWAEGRRYPDSRYPDSRYPDARYPDDRRYPSALPETVWGVVFGRGDRWAARGVREWLGRTDVRPRYRDADRDGRPEMVSWHDARGALLQRWYDDTRDGRADRVEVFRDGRVARVLR